MPKILFTVDTEIGDLYLQYFYHTHSFDTSVLGKVKGKEVGANFILDVLDENELKGEFFLSPYPYKDFNNEIKYKRLSLDIVNRGHGLQLHTHPFTDYQRRFMYELSSIEQKEYIQHGINKLKEWTNVFPLAHRAGSYGANNTTLKVLKKCGIKFDLSYFHHASHCKLELNTINDIIDTKDVIQIPVTVTEKVYDYGVWKKSSFQKIDIEHIGDAKIAYQILQQFNDDAVVVLFLHSFSFVKRRFSKKFKRYAPFKINYQLVHEFQKLMQWIAKDPNMSTIQIKNIKQTQKIEVPKKVYYFPLTPIIKKIKSFLIS